MIIRQLFIDVFIFIFWLNNRNYDRQNLAFAGNSLDVVNDNLTIN